MFVVIMIQIQNFDDIVKLLNENNSDGLKLSQSEQTKIFNWLKTNIFIRCNYHVTTDNKDEAFCLAFIEFWHKKNINSEQNPKAYFQKIWKNKLYDLLNKERRYSSLFNNVENELTIYFADEEEDDETTESKKNELNELAQNRSIGANFELSPNNDDPVEYEKKLTICKDIFENCLSLVLPIDKKYLAGIILFYLMNDNRANDGSFNQFTWQDAVIEIYPELREIEIMKIVKDAIQANSRYVEKDEKDKFKNCCQEQLKKNGTKEI